MTQRNGNLGFRIQLLSLHKEPPSVGLMCFPILKYRGSQPLGMVDSVFRHWTARTMRLLGQSARGMLTAVESNRAKPLANWSVTPIGVKARLLTSSIPVNLVSGSCCLTPPRTGAGLAHARETKNRRSPIFAGSRAKAFGDRLPGQNANAALATGYGTIWRRPPIHLQQERDHRIPP